MQTTRNALGLMHFPRALPWTNFPFRMRCWAIAKWSSRLVATEPRTRTLNGTTQTGPDLRRAVRGYVRAYAQPHGRRKAAEDLGVSRHTLWRFLERDQAGPRGFRATPYEPPGDSPPAPVLPNGQGCDLRGHGYRGPGAHAGCLHRCRSNGSASWLSGWTAATGPSSPPARPRRPCHLQGHTLTGRPIRVPQDLLGSVATRTVHQTAMGLSRGKDGRPR